MPGPSARGPLATHDVPTSQSSCVPVLRCYGLVTAEIVAVTDPAVASVEVESAETGVGREPEPAARVEGQGDGIAGGGQVDEQHLSVHGDAAELPALGQAEPERAVRGARDGAGALARNGPGRGRQGVRGEGSVMRDAPNLVWVTERDEPRSHTTEGRPPLTLEIAARIVANPFDGTLYAILPRRCETYRWWQHLSRDRRKATIRWQLV